MMEIAPVRAFVRIRLGCGTVKHDNKTVSIVKECGEVVEYEFDGVFGSGSTQLQVFAALKSVVPRLMDGYNQTLFCYGNTGSGKTYTMVGTRDSPGVMYNLVVEILKHREFVMSYMEIYNEKIYDLLEPKELMLRELNKNIVIPNLFSKRVRVLKDFEELFSKGTGNRTTAETKLNKNSSRSHAILRLCVGECKLHLIDLAGSENNRKTGNEGMRLAESNNINRSLFVLGKVVNAVLKMETRIPYRDSKLTRILQDSLGGNSLCYIIATIIDDGVNLGNSINTLNFASKSRNVINLGVRESSSFDGTIGSEGKSTYEKHDSEERRKPLSLKTNIRFNLSRKKENKTQRNNVEKGSISKDDCLVSSTLLGRDRKEGTGSRRTSCELVKSDAAITDEREKMSFRNRKKCNNSSMLGLSSDKVDVVLSPHTKEKSYRAFLKRAQDFESVKKYKLALEDYRTIQRFCDNDFVRHKIETITKSFKASRKKLELTQGDVLHILNSGKFFDIKKLPSVGDKRAQAIVEFVNGGNFFEELSDLKLLFTEKVVKSILTSVDNDIS